MTDSHRHTVAAAHCRYNTFLFIAIKLRCILLYLYYAHHTYEYIRVLMQYSTERYLTATACCFLICRFFLCTAAAACRQQSRSLIPASIFMTVLFYFASVRFCFAYNWQAISHNTRQQQQQHYKYRTKPTNEF